MANIPLLLQNIVVTANDTATSVVVEKSNQVASEIFGKHLATEVADYFKIQFWAAEIIISLAILIIFWLIYRFIRYFGVKWALRLTAKTKSNIDDKMVKGLSKPLSLIIMAFGIFLALSRLTILDHYQGIINKVYVGFLTFIGILAFSRVIKILIEWYAETVSQRTNTPIDTEFIPTLRKVVNIIIWIVGLLLVLDQLGYKITTLIAGLGIGGLAVALALQDTLNNFFSGFYMMVDRPIRSGDFIHIDSGYDGFVEQIGWRTTRIRTFANNIIIIPNAKLAQSVITNYYLPLPQTAVYVDCGVGYDNDLEHVEKVTIDVAKQVLQKVEGADKKYEPLVRWNTFGDSNVNFKVILSVTDFMARGLLQHEFIKALFARFKQENIEIAFPSRSVYIEKIPEISPKNDKAGQGT